MHCDHQVVAVVEAASVHVADEVDQSVVVAQKHVDCIQYTVTPTHVTTTSRNSPLNKISFRIYTTRAVDTVRHEEAIA